MLALITSAISIYSEARPELRACGKVFACNHVQDAIALAKRGENIVRCFIGVSPGGTRRVCSLTATMVTIKSYGALVISYT